MVAEEDDCDASGAVTVLVYDSVRFCSVLYSVYVGRFG